MKQLLMIARERGLFVEWDRLGDYLRGLYDHATGTIVLNSSMSMRLQRYALAHELGHAWHEHRWTGDPHRDARAERLADSHAARLLITPLEYARAESLVGPEPGALATELGVPLGVITAWQLEARSGRSWTGTGPIRIVASGLAS